MTEQTFHHRTEDKPFFVCDGRHIHSLSELYTCLSSMSDESFLHHVNAERNDFASWIEYVFHEHQLATHILHLKTRHDIQNALRDWFSHHLQKEYRSKIAGQNSSHLPHEHNLPIQSESQATPSKRLLQSAPTAPTSLPYRSDFLARSIDFLAGVIIGGVLIYFFL
jgi:hypothetical protein